MKAMIKKLENCLDEETVNGNELLKEDHWITYRSDKEVEENTSSAKRDTRLFGRKIVKHYI